MKKLLFLAFLIPSCAFATDGSVTLIGKLAPKNGAFVGLVDSSQTLNTTTNFNGNLSAADDTVQKALDTLDSLTVGSGGITVYPASTTAAFPYGLTASTGIFTSTMTLSGSRAVSITAPSDGQVLKWDSVNSVWKPAADNTGAAGGALINAKDGGVSILNTSTFNFTGAQFVISDSGGEALVLLDASSVTLQGQNVLSLSSASATYLTLSSAAATYSSGNFLSLSSATATYFPITSSSTLLTVSSAAATYIQTGTALGNSIYPATATATFPYGANFATATIEDASSPTLILNKTLAGSDAGRIQFDTLGISRAYWANSISGFSIGVSTMASTPTDRIIIGNQPGSSAQIQFNPNNKGLSLKESAITFSNGATMDWLNNGVNVSSLTAYGTITSTSGFMGGDYKFSSNTYFHFDGAQVCLYVLGTSEQCWPSSPGTSSDLLLENGFHILLETGDKLILE